MADRRPRRIVQLDLAAGLPAGGVEASDRPVFLVVWWRDRLLGYAELHRTVTAPELAARVARLVGPSVGRRLFGAGYPTPRPGLKPSDPPSTETVLALSQPLRTLDNHAVPVGAGGRLSATLAICTHNRPAALERCLRSIAAATDVPDEVLVIDNAPHTARTRELLTKFPDFRYLPQPRPGLSAARNTAVRASTGQVLAFVDDDVVVQPRWLTPLLHAFADPEVMAATGLVLPAELETEAQVAFEIDYGGLSRGFERARYDREFVRGTVSYGMPVWMIGAGANMAIRRAAFDLVGEFNERLGPSGGSGAGDDSEFWYRLLAEGWACRYEPDSVVFHYHRREASALANQIREYTSSHMAALFVQFARFRHLGNLRRAFLGLPKYFVRRAPCALARTAADHRTAPGPDLYRPQVSGYLRGLRYLPLAAAKHSPRHKTPLGAFLSANPFPRPYTLGFFYREKMRAIHRVAPDLPAREVLEVGGGRSGLARLLYPDASITTLDVDEELASADVNRDRRVRFVVGDATALPFPDGSFDVVTFFDVLEHIPADRRAVEEALRVLRPGGFVLVSTPSDRWRFPYYRALRAICPTDADVMAEWGHVRRGYAPDDLLELFGWRPNATAGFISPLTALGFDIAWSKLPETARRALCMLVSPITWPAYAMHPTSRSGTEIAAAWRKPDT